MKSNFSRGLPLAASAKRVAGALTLALFVATGAARAADAYTLVPAAHGHALKAPDGRTVFEYMTVKPEITNLEANSVCCFHPVNTPSGERVTDLAPGDHHHHRGIFLAWHTMEFHEEADFSALGPLGPTHGWDIHRGDFWGWGSYAPTERRLIRNRDVKLLEANADRAVVRIRNTWEIHDRVLMHETDTVTVQERKGAFVLDVLYRLEPVVKLVLNHNSFGGFCIRARNDGDSAYVSPDGEVTLPDAHYSATDLNWPAKDWYDFTIDLNSGKTVGITVIDHPDNPPSTWHNPRYIWMINPCITARAPFTVPKGGRLDLRYRIVVHDGPTPVEQLEKLTREWRVLRP